MASKTGHVSRAALAFLLAASPALRADFGNGFEDPLLVINEIEGNDLSGGEDWIEFHNPRETASDVSLAYFTDSDPTHVFMFPVGTIVYKDTEVDAAGDSRAVMAALARLQRD